MDWFRYERFTRRYLTADFAKASVASLQRVEALVGLGGEPPAILERWRLTSAIGCVPNQEIVNGAFAISMLARYIASMPGKQPSPGSPA